MNGGIVIYGVPNDANNHVVQEKIRALRGVSVSVVVCPPSVCELYRVPFVQDEDGGRHFGMEGIERFVTRRLEAQLAS